MDNLAVTPEAVRSVIEHGNDEIYCTASRPQPAGFGALRQVQDIAGALLRKYLAALYAQENLRWEQQNLRLADLTEKDPNLRWKGYEVRARRQFAAAVRALVQEADKLYRDDLTHFPRIRFDRHLYQPLLAYDQGQRYDSAPPPLNEGESRFVRDLRNWLPKNPQAIEGREVFLLRNRSRGRGISFFSPKDGEAFYPDFILWVLEDGQRPLAFIDPHGLGRAQGLSDPTIQLHRRLAELEQQVQASCCRWRVRLSSFIVAPTPYEEARRNSWIADHSREKLEAQGVFFQSSDGADYIQRLWVALNESQPAEKASCRRPS